MTLRMYSIYDKVAREYCFPVSARNDAVAARQFQQEMQRVPESVRSDYSLVCVGEWDSDMGEIVPLYSEIDLVSAMAAVKDE